MSYTSPDRTTGPITTSPGTLIVLTFPAVSNGSASSQQSTPQIVNVIIDANIRETHSGQAEITQHRVETGSNISDNIRPVPKRISLESIVSNTPITPPVPSPTNGTPGIYPSKTPLSAGWPGGQNTPPLVAGGVSMTSLTFPTVFDRVADCYNQLEYARIQGALCAVYTSLAVYPQMAIHSLSVPRNAKTGNVLQFTIEMMEIITVATQGVIAPAPKIKKVSRGNQPPMPATAQQQHDANSTTARLIGDGIRAK